MSENNHDEKDVSKLQAALKAERTAHKETADKLKESEATLSAANAKIAEYATLENPNAAGITRLVTDSAKAIAAKETATLQQRVTALEDELAESRKNGDALLGQLASRTIRDEVRESARAAFVRDDALADVLTIASFEMKLVDGRVQAEDGRDVAQWLDDRKHVSPHWWPAARGAGARGSSIGDWKAYDPSDNPFASGKSWSLTRQGQLMQQDPERAKHLQQLASV